MPVMDLLKNSLAPIQVAISRAIVGLNHLVSENEDGVGWLDRKLISPAGNPIITARDVTDYGSVGFVADPFLYLNDETWHLFFEIQNGQREPSAVIGHATSTNGGATWEYDRIVLEYRCHLSFPYVFSRGDDIYMLPDQGCPPAEQQITLFKASDFPYEWEPIVNLVDPEYGPLDPVIFRHNNRWWVIVGGGNNDSLYAYNSTNLESSEWMSHEENPIVTDRVRAGRPAGRPYTGPGGPILYLQDNGTQYGDKIRAYRITELTPKEYQDEPVSNQPMLAGQNRVGWNGSRMHHIDAQNLDGDDWVCVVDGDIGIGRTFAGSCWAIGAYRLRGAPVNREKPDL